MYRTALRRWTAESPPRRAHVLFLRRYLQSQVSLLRLGLAGLALCSASSSQISTPGAGAVPLRTDESVSVTENPILFVTQVPVPNPGDYRTVVSTFSNHDGDPTYCARGGDLYVRYCDGSLRNLTAEAGYGMSGLQIGPNAISVREPCVHWSGTKAVFSMVVGAPAQGDDTTHYFWQVYEVTGLQQGQSAVITRIPQPSNSNNVSPCYASDGRILLTSDRTRTGVTHLYPQLDEYEAIPTNTGVWSLDPVTGSGFLMNHAPSGAFKPFVDSYGRVVFTRWDHLERDHLKVDSDMSATDNIDYGTFNYSDESAFAFDLGNDLEVFPEASRPWTDFINNNPGFSGDLNGYDPALYGNSFNLFSPWTLNQDGTEEETLNHVGRHELRPYLIPEARLDDPSIVPGNPYSWIKNKTQVGNMFHLRELALLKGWYLFVDAPEFFTYGAGQVLVMNGRQGFNANQMAIYAITHPDTSSYDTGTPSAEHSGLYRTPLLLTTGQLIASHTDETLPTFDANANYDFRLKQLFFNGAYFEAGLALTGGIVKSVSYFDPYNRVDYTGPLWELDAVEVVARPVPPDTAESALAGPEQQALNEEGIGLSQLKTYLADNDLALVVSRDVTTRDRNDRQQPFNLRVSGGGTKTTGDNGKIYDVTYMQFFQGDQVRGLTLGGTQPIPGRRVLAQAMHDPGTKNPPATPAGPPGSVSIAADGSVAALVPARRAMSWQLVDALGTPVVRERYWVSFQPGEIRTCTSCHGVNDIDQALQPPPTNKPQALNLLLQHLKSTGEL